MRNRRSNIPVKAPALVIGIGAAIAAAGYSAGDIIAGSMPTLIGKSCNIKGNVSLDNGEKIYHVPGQDHYSATRVRTAYGERWFCSEAEALAAGWRKSRT